MPKAAARRPTAWFTLVFIWLEASLLGLCASESLLVDASGDSASGDRSSGDSDCCKKKRRSDGFRVSSAGFDSVDDEEETGASAEQGFDGGCWVSTTVGAAVPAADGTGA